MRLGWAFARILPYRGRRPTPRPTSRRIGGRRIGDRAPPARRGGALPGGPRPRRAELPGTAFHLPAWTRDDGGHPHPSGDLVLWGDHGASRARLARLLPPLRRLRDPLGHQARAKAPPAARPPRRRATQDPARTGPGQV